MTTTTELTGARHALDVALNHLNEAETDYIDVAVYEYTSALARLDAVVRRAKAEEDKTREGEEK